MTRQERKEKQEMVKYYVLSEVVDQQISYFMVLGEFKYLEKAGEYLKNYDYFYNTQSIIVREDDFYTFCEKGLVVNRY